MQYTPYDKPSRQVVVWKVGLRQMQQLDIFHKFEEELPHEAVNRLLSTACDRAKYGNEIVPDCVVDEDALSENYSLLGPVFEKVSAFALSDRYLVRYRNTELQRTPFNISQAVTDLMGYILTKPPTPAIFDAVDAREHLRSKLGIFIGCRLSVDLVMAVMIRRCSSEIAMRLLLDLELRTWPNESTQPILKLHHLKGSETSIHIGQHRQVTHVTINRL